MYNMNFCNSAEGLKYKRSINHNRSFNSKFSPTSNFNKNLSKIISDNKIKEDELEKTHKIRLEMERKKHWNDLHQQVKQQEEARNQLKISNLTMDEEYITM